MSVPEDFAVVLVTAPDMDLARRLAKGALEAKLAACANIVPGGRVALLVAGETRKQRRGAAHFQNAAATTTQAGASRPGDSPLRHPGIRRPPPNHRQPKIPSLAHRQYSERITLSLIFPDRATVRIVFFGFGCFDVGFLGEDEAFDVLLGGRSTFCRFFGRGFGRLGCSASPSCT